MPRDASYPPLRLAFPERGDWIFSGILAQRASLRPDRPFLQSMGGPPLSYGEADRRVNRLAHGLLALGIGRGDRVLIMLPNSIDYMLTWWAANRIGAVEVSVNTAYKGYFLEHLVNNSGGRIMVVARELLGQVAPSEEKLTQLETLVVHEGGRGEPGAPPSFKRFRVLAFEELDARREDPPGIALSPRDLCAIMYTSGTTGPSKGVMMPNAQCHLFAECTASLTRLTEDDVYFVATPLYHGNAPIMQVYPSLLVGARAVIGPRFSASEWVRQVRQAGATVTNLLGVMMDFIFRQPLRDDDRQHRLRLVLGQPAPAAIVEEFKKRFGVARILEYYGMTEIGVVTMMPYDDVRPGSCGKAVSEWFDLRIADPETDEELPPGQVGELLVRPKAPWVFNQGYWGAPDQSLEALRNVWYHTGDALKRDEDGYYYFVDRMGDVIRRRAVNISSFDVETVIGEHPAVRECAAVAVPTEFAGGEDEVKVCVVLHAGARIVPEEFLAWCEDRLPYFAVPRYVEVVAELPRTPSNKVQKYLLRQAGITAATWDREKAGYRLKEEVRRAEARGHRPREARG
ncbi:MAG: AMP-binding protein [Candidatus Rokubacteria bacterium]|nr:AMP-binding protein [Candidatus Rokubacteria bacterium]